MAPPVIEYFYAPISGFAYLGEPRLRAIAAAAGAAIRYRPVDIGQVFAASETTPPAKQSAARLSYRNEDMARWARRLGMPLNATPKHWPAPVDLACRCVVGAESVAADVGAASFAILKAVWVEDRNIADPGDLRAALDGAGLDGAAILEAAEGAGPAAAEHTRDAIAARVFGSPTYVVAGERFWGQDRLSFVAEALGLPASAREGA